MANTIVDVVLLAIAALIIWRCTANGFIKGLLRSARVLLAFVIAYFLGNPVGAFLYKSLFYNPIYKFVYGKVDGLYQGASGTLTGEEVLNKFPDFLNDGALAEKLNAIESTSEDWIESVSQSIASPFATVVSNLVAYVLVFVLALILLSIVIKLLDSLVSNITVLDRINKLLGCVWGILLALAACLAIASLIKLFFADAPIYADSVVLKFFGESALLKIFGFLDVGKSVFASLHE